MMCNNLSFFVCVILVKKNANCVFLLNVCHEHYVLQNKSEKYSKMLELIQSDWNFFSY